ncbi:hypothetical protein THAOC_12626 [Thalassiosira oceanica]|uniref:Uncharacterized protein n=1 Tax=Thalassiosira oceanica TaxID=159749 RepID=K0SZH9_THAOC|nr:hypothetical protein THAOC_12626 [Thalassiosira oceanica]|eukprot:EJK66456.1 hypothetical protein THAOC_12626 [Thalassiosira oceanica]
MGLTHAFDILLYDPCPNTSLHGQEKWVGFRLRVGVYPPTHPLTHPPTRFWYAPGGGGSGARRRGPRRGVRGAARGGRRGRAAVLHRSLHGLHGHDGRLAREARQVLRERLPALPVRSRQREGQVGEDTEPRVPVRGRGGGRGRIRRAGVVHPGRVARQGPLLQRGEGLVPGPPGPRPAAAPCAGGPRAPRRAPDDVRRREPDGGPPGRPDRNRRAAGASPRRAAGGCAAPPGLGRVVPRPDRGGHRADPEARPRRREADAGLRRPPPRPHPRVEGRRDGAPVRAGVPPLEGALRRPHGRPRDVGDQDCRVCDDGGRRRGGGSVRSGHEGEGRGPGHGRLRRAWGVPLRRGGVDSVQGAGIRAVRVSDPFDFSFLSFLG